MSIVRTYPQQSRHQKVTFWINTFIPRDIPTLTEVVKTGEHRGKTAIRNPARPFTHGFLTDQRSFSNSLTVTSRTRSRVEILLNGVYPTLGQVQNESSDTHEVELVGEGRETCKARSDEWVRGQPVFSPPGITGLTKPWVTFDGWDGKRFSLNVAAAAGNPCAPGAELIAKIDYHGIVSLDVERMTISFVGKIDEIPAYEMYAQVDNFPAVTVFQQSIVSPDVFGRQPGFDRLIGPANRPVIAADVPLLGPAYGIGDSTQYQIVR